MKKRVLAIIMAVVTCLGSCFSNLLILNVSADGDMAYLPGEFCGFCGHENLYLIFTDEIRYVERDAETHSKNLVHYKVCSYCGTQNEILYQVTILPHNCVEGKWEGTDVHIGAYHYYDFEYFCIDCGYDDENYQVELPCRGNGMCVWPFSNPIIHEHVTE